MSTHNMGFYEDLTKDIFQLSSIIIKYAPYLFSCLNNYYYSCCIKITAVSYDVDFLVVYFIARCTILIKEQKREALWDVCYLFHKEPIFSAA